MKIIKKLTKNLKANFGIKAFPNIKPDSKKMIETCKNQLNKQITSKKIIKNIQTDFKTKKIPDFIYMSMIDHFLENQKISEAIKTLTNSFLEKVILDRPFFEEVLDELLNSEILENDFELVYSFYSQNFRPSFPVLCILHDAICEKKIKEELFKKNCEIFVEEYNNNNSKEEIDIYDVENKINILNKEEISENNKNDSKKFNKDKNEHEIINLKLDNIKEKDKKELFSLIEKYQYLDEDDYDETENDK